MDEPTPLEEMEEIVRERLLADPHFYDDPDAPPRFSRASNTRVSFGPLTGDDYGLEYRASVALAKAAAALADEPSAYGSNAIRVTAYGSNSRVGWHTR